MTTTGQDVPAGVAVETPILHVDMDAFFASVTTRDRPDLADVPVIVGGGHRGVVLSANYLARQHGVRSALPMTRARRLCPEAVVLPPDSSAIDTATTAVSEIFRRVTPLVRMVSVDEAFLDVRGAVRRLGSPEAIAEQVRASVHDEQGITCSAGVAATMPVAKIASRRAKPDGLVVVRPGEVTGFLHPLDVGELWGVGERTREQLRRLGLETVGDLAHTPVGTLRGALGAHAARHLHDLAWGLGGREVAPRAGPHDPGRSMGADKTLARDTDDREVVSRELLRLAARVTGRMRTAEVAGRTIALRLRFADFTTITRSRTLPEATDVTVEVHRVVTALYDALGLRRTRVRLVGVRIEGLVPRSSVHPQLVLGQPDHGWAEVDREVDRATSRFGSAAVQPAVLMVGSHRGPRGRGRGRPAPTEG